MVMVMFGIGAAIPLLGLGMLSREAMQRWRLGLTGLNRRMRNALGGLLTIVGVSILTDMDKRLEAVLVSLSPEWLTRMTTAF